MLTTRLLSKYLARRMAGQAAKRELSQKRVSLPMRPGKTKNAVGVRGLGDAPAGGFEEEAVEHFEPLTPEQAQAVLVRLRKTASLLSPWRLIGWQVLVGVGVSMLALAWSGEKRIALSAAYGAIAVVLPAGMFAWGVMRRRAPQPALHAGLRFLVWEAAKVGLTVAMLFAAPAVVASVSWLALLAGFVVTMKVYWLAIWLYPVRKNSV